MTEADVPGEWTYQSDRDMWISADGRTAIDGAIVRYIAEAHLKRQLGPARRASDKDYQLACEEVLSGRWAA